MLHRRMAALENVVGNKASDALVSNKSRDRDLAHGKHVELQIVPSPMDHKVHDGYSNATEHLKLSKSGQLCQEIEFHGPTEVERMLTISDRKQLEAMAAATTSPNPSGMSNLVDLLIDRLEES